MKVVALEAWDLAAVSGGRFQQGRWGDVDALVTDEIADILRVLQTSVGSSPGYGSYGKKMVPAP